MCDELFFGRRLPLLAAKKVVREPHEALCKGKEEDGAGHVEERVEEGDLELIVFGEDGVQDDILEGSAEPAPAKQEYREDDGAETVEEKVDDGGSPCIGLRADGGKERRQKRRWMMAALLALGCAPMEERSAVTQVPMLEPMTT